MKKSTLWAPAWLHAYVDGATTVMEEATWLTPTLSRPVNAASPALNTFDVVVILLLSNVVQKAIIGNDDSLLGGIV